MKYDIISDNVYMFKNKLKSVKNKFMTKNQQETSLRKWYLKSIKTT